MQRVTATVPAGSRVAPGVAWLLCGLSLALISCAAVLGLLAGGDWWGVIRLLALVSSALVGGMVASRKPANPVGWFLLVFAVCLAAMVFAENYARYGLLTEPGSLPFAKAMSWPPHWLWAPGVVVILLFLPLYFPDGRLVSPRWRWVVRFAALFSVFTTVFSAFQPGDEQGTGFDNPLGIEALGSLPWVIDIVILPLWLGLLFVSAASLVVRFRRSGTEQRQQIKWLAFAASAIPLWFLVSPLVQETVPVLFEIGEILAFAAVPVAVGIAVLKYRLYDIDLVINRTLVYGVLTACVVGIYVLVVGYLGAAFRVEDNLAISVLAAGVVAVLFAPLRDRLQRAVNRLMYGERDDPYAVLSRLGQSLEGTLEPQSVLPTVVETIVGALKVPHARVSLSTDGGFVAAAEHGAPSGEPLILPLVYQNESVGRLEVSPRARDEPFSPADRRLLEDLARQAGIAAHAVMLTTDLQRSRERLVTAREEERRRLRRDLHDGVGPQLAALTLKIETARNRLAHDPVAVELLSDLAERARATVADVRRSVHALRPPALDELGLIPALRETAAQYGQNGLKVSVEAPEDLPPLPAAVEVAAYRIAQEAMTNTARHAGARRCTVSFGLDDGGSRLCLEISDDGTGIGPERGTGVGFSSMRERAEELGGRCEVETKPEGGTLVRAELPISSGGGA